MQSFFQNFGEFINRKNVRMGLAAVCLTFFVQSVLTLISGAERTQIINAGGGLLFWGGWAVINTLKAFGRTISGLNIVVNVGLAVIILSLFVR